MKGDEKWLYLLWISILVALVVVFSTIDAFAKTIDVEDNPASITVLASSSLTDAMTHITRKYAKDSGYSVVVNYSSPVQLADAIVSGEPADIYISEDAVAMNQLKQKGVVDVFSQTAIANNRMVLIASKDHYLSRFVRKEVALERLFSDLSDRVLLVTADPDEGASGVFTKESIMRLGQWQKIRNFIVPTQTSRQALYLIAKGRQAGLTYYSEAHNNNEVDVLAELPATLHTPITYRAAVVAGNNMSLARDFLAYLKSDPAQDTLKRHGFAVN